MIRFDFASYTGTAPIDVSSGDNNRHRLNPGGNRRLNHALHIAAVVQYRMPGDGQDYYRRKRDQGKTHLEALRCLIGGVSGSAARFDVGPWLPGRIGGWPRCRAAVTASLSTATLDASGPRDRR